MGDNSTNPTMLTIDTKKYRLRVHKSTIHQLGDPKLIQLLVNPRDKLMAIRGADQNSSVRDRIKVERQMKDVDDCVEMYSKHLISKLLEAFPELEIGFCYNLCGRVVSAEKLAVFPISAVIVTISEGGELYARARKEADY